MSPTSQQRGARKGQPSQDEEGYWPLPSRPPRRKWWSQSWKSLWTTGCCQISIGACFAFDNTSLTQRSIPICSAFTLLLEMSIPTTSSSSGPPGLGNPSVGVKACTAGVSATARGAPLQTPLSSTHAQFIFNQEAGSPRFACKHFHKHQPFVLDDR